MMIFEILGIALLFVVLNAADACKSDAMMDSCHRRKEVERIQNEIFELFDLSCNREMLKARRRMLRAY